MNGFIARAHEIALAVGDVFENRRDRVLDGIFREPDSRRQLTSVGKRNKEVLDLAYGEGKVGAFAVAHNRMLIPPLYAEAPDFALTRTTRRDLRVLSYRLRGHRN